MSILPTDWPSFLWGLVIGALGVLFSGFLKKLGEDSYLALKKRLFPEPPEPVQVATNFEATQFEAGSYSWVSEFKIHDKEAEGYTFYRQAGAKCFRIIHSRPSGQIKEFLMVKPDAKPKGT